MEKVFQPGTEAPGQHEFGLNVRCSKPAALRRKGS